MSYLNFRISSSIFWTAQKSWSFVCIFTVLVTMSQSSKGSGRRKDSLGLWICWFLGSCLPVPCQFVGGVELRSSFRILGGDPHIVAECISVWSLCLRNLSLRPAQSPGGVTLWSLGPSPHFLHQWLSVRAAESSSRAAPWAASLCTSITQLMIFNVACCRECYRRVFDAVMGNWVLVFKETDKEHRVGPF